MTLPEHDIDTVLRWAYPQGTALLAREGGLPILRAGARAMLSSPGYALEVLSPEAVRKLGRALLALGQQHVCVAERMIQMAEEKTGGESEPEKADSRSYNTEQPG
jgi:hypothetical protein